MDRRTFVAITGGALIEPMIQSNRDAFASFAQTQALPANVGGSHGLPASGLIAYAPARVQRSRHVSPTAPARASTAYSCPPRLVGGYALLSVRSIDSLDLPRPARSGPAVYRRVDSVRNVSPRVDGSFGHVRIDAHV
jgi:hypothetical protein